MQKTEPGSSHVEPPSTREENEDKPPSNPLPLLTRPAVPGAPRKVTSLHGAAGYRFHISTQSRAFRRQFYPEASASEWNDWRWQLRSRIRSLETLGRLVRLSDDEQAMLKGDAQRLPLAIPPYYAALLDRKDPLQPLRRSVVPSIAERLRSPGEDEDPLSEDSSSPLPGLVHRYPDRVLLLVTSFCSTYCRYCTRSRLVGHHGGYQFSKTRLEKAFAYLEATPAVRDVLISGGDPLTLATDQLDWILGRLRRIRHVELVRIGTKAPVVLPMRVTRELVRVLRKYHPLWMSVHFTHPDELTREVQDSCGRLADAGIPLGSQTVLLAGVNDDVQTMKQLMHGLLRIRVKPYYLYQCDPIVGSAHFRTPVAKGLEIIGGLRGHTTGYAVPNYVIDAPGGGGKIALTPESVVGREGQDLVLSNYQGRQFRYPDTGELTA